MIGQLASLLESETLYWQFGNVGRGVIVRYAMSSDRSDKSILPVVFVFASGRQGRIGRGVTVKYAMSSDKSDKSGVSETDSFTLPVVPAQQVDASAKICQNP